MAGGNAKKPREKKPKKPSRLTRQQKILIVVAVLLALVLAVVVACQSLFVKPDLETKKPETEEEELDYGDGVRPRSDGERKSEDFYTVLILGRDTGGGGNTDTMLLASYDVTNQKATVMSIPRDTMVNVCFQLGVECIEVLDYVIAQTDVGRMVGTYQGLPIIGKGGLTGYDTIAVDIVDRLFREAAREMQGDAVTGRPQYQMK